MNIKNKDDNECFKWYQVRYLNPAHHNPRRIAKANKYFAKKLDFKYIKLPVKIRDIHKIGKMKSIGISVFCYEIKKKYPIYISKQCCEEKHDEFLLVGEGGKEHNLLIKDFNRFMYDHSLYHGRKHFSHYYLHALITEEILKRDIKDGFKVNGK